MSNTETDYYEVLGVSREANEKEIRLAYRKLALALHPDKQSARSTPQEKNANTLKFTAVGEAYSVLSDAEKKAIYDKYGIAGLQAQSQGGMTYEQAMELYWSFFKVPGWQRKQEASVLHGAYVAGAGIVTAPFVGVGMGATMMGFGGLAGGSIMIGGVVKGGRDFVQGARELAGAPKAALKEDQVDPSPFRKMTHIVTEPVKGTVFGAATAGLGVVAGATTMVAGGLGGAYYNARDGYIEMTDAGRSSNNGNASHQEQQGNSEPLSSSEEETAKKGHGLFQRGMSGGGEEN